jgi:hypothetical protein
MPWPTASRPRRHYCSQVVAGLEFLRKGPDEAANGDEEEYADAPGHIKELASSNPRCQAPECRSHSASSANLGMAHALLRSLRKHSFVAFRLPLGSEEAASVGLKRSARIEALEAALNLAVRRLTHSISSPRMSLTNSDDLLMLGSVARSWDAAGIASTLSTGASTLRHEVLKPFLSAARRRDPERKGRRPCQPWSPRSERREVSRVGSAIDHASSRSGLQSGSRASTVRSLPPSPLFVASVERL